MSRTLIADPVSAGGGAGGSWMAKTMHRLQAARRAGVLVAALMTGGLMPGAVQTQAESARLIESTPEQDEIVDGTNVLISLLFSVPVDHESSRLTLKSRKSVRHLQPSLEAGAKYLVGNAGRLAPGAYELVWTARLANGQTRSGTIPFTVR